MVCLKVNFIFFMRKKATSVLCVQCGKWMHDRCAGVMAVTSKFSGNFASMKCEGNIKK